MPERRPVDWPMHPVGSMRWVCFTTDHRAAALGQPRGFAWERVEVVDVYGLFGTRFGDYPELVDVCRPSGEISTGHFPNYLIDQVPANTTYPIRRPPEVRHG